MNAGCRELLHWCHLCEKLSAIFISKSAPLFIEMHYATGKMRIRDLPSNHMQVFYPKSAS